MLKCIVNKDGVQEYVRVDEHESAEIEITSEELKSKLAETDYRIIKCYEYQLVGIQLPYNIADLHAQRQEIRDKINQLEGNFDV